MKIFGHSRPFFGVLHLSALPGAPGTRGDMEKIVAQAVRDARQLLRGGFDGLIVENFGDAPFFAEAVPPETIAAMGVVAAEIRRLGEFPLGINVLRNDAEAALGVAVAAGAQFIRVNVLAGTMLTDQGLVTGPAAALLRKRKLLRARTAIWADLLVKHARPLAPVDPEELARDQIERAGADALILTGSRTGAPVDPTDLRQLRRRLPRIAWIVGSGIVPENLETYWEAARGFIVGSTIRRGGRAGNPIVASRVRRLMRVRRSLTTV
jgi:membrane complex biogenesis BtpA family protein